ncbi:MAG: hypothetical protein EOP04_10395 [Proteobacteria bacterium]|nr:MAG: hypothetical protein EOP04_10395 [Pseudomonadota bacterium]
MNSKYFLLLIAVAFASCKTELSFDSAKWKLPFDIAPNPDRSLMAKDLLTKRLLNGMDTAKVIDLLGQPQYRESNTYSYPVKVEFGTDIDPVATEDLEVRFIGGRVDTAFIRKWKKSQ